MSTALPTASSAYGPDRPSAVATVDNATPQGSTYRRGNSVQTNGAGSVIVPLMAVLPAPSMVSARLVPVTELAALRVSVPASDWISVVPARVTVPPQELFPLRLRNAPLLPTPVPVRLSASAPTVIPP